MIEPQTEERQLMGDPRVPALEARIAALEAENERLLSHVCRWSESCTGRHGSQEQCVTLETSAEPPTWEALRGAAPDATGDLSSEKFVRKLRNEWPDPSAPKSETEGK